MSARTERRHRQMEREGRPPPNLRLGRSPNAAEEARNAICIAFVGAVLAVLEDGEIPSLEALKTYPQGRKSPPTPPKWREPSIPIEQLLGLTGCKNYRPIAVAAWDFFCTIELERPHGFGKSKGGKVRRAELKKWAQDFTKKGFAGGVEPHHITKWAAGTAKDVRAIRKRRANLEPVLGISKRMASSYRKQDAYIHASAALRGFARVKLASKSANRRNKSANPEEESDIDERNGWTD